MATLNKLDNQNLRIMASNITRTRYFLESGKTIDDISLVVLGVHQPDQLKRILSGQTELAKSTLCLFPNNWDGLSNAPLISKLDFLTSLKVNMGVAMSFKNLACVILLLPNASYVMAGSQLQLSSDVMVDQKMKNIVVQTSYFKTKLTTQNLFELAITQDHSH